MFGCAGSLLLSRLFSSCGERGLLSSSGVRASHCRDFSRGCSPVPGCVGSRRRSAQAQRWQLPGCRAQAQQLWHRGLAAPEPVGSSRIRDQTHVSCIGRWILYHQATKEALGTFLTGVTGEGDAAGVYKALSRDTAECPVRSRAALSPTKNPPS